MDDERLKKRNKLLLFLVLAGLLCFVLAEWLISVMQKENTDWEPVNIELEELLDWESDFAPAEPAVININEASEAALDSLDGIGPAKAKEIVRFREENGPFTSIEQIMDVPGIGPATYENIKGRITIGEEEQEAVSDELNNEGETAASTNRADANSAN